MSLGWNEIRERALKFSHEYADTTSEAADRQTFWNDFFGVFGISRKRVATFEKSVERLGGNRGSIDLFWPGRLIMEHKSAGENLDKALEQALGYTHNLTENEMPSHIIVCDFQNFRILHLDAEPGKPKEHAFTLKELKDKVRLFGFMLGFQEVEVKTEDPVNAKAVKAVAKLHDALKDSGYTGHELEVCLVRLVYCFFADDTGIFDEVDSFLSYIENRTNIDGSDVGSRIDQIFQVLNTPIENRQTTLEEELQKLPYVDGPLFHERISTPSFDSGMRETLIACASFDWGKVSPVIFGSMFQSVMDQDLRDQLGAHYTSETNIFKVIDSLFLDGLKKELASAGKNKQKLKAFLEKLRRLTFLDPACGCGNFLVVSYRELRRLELDALKRLHVDELSGKRQTTMLEIGQLSKVNVDQFYGIEIEEFPARVAELALWLTDHQMNMELSEEFGEAFKRLPLSTHPNIQQKNALRTDWNDVVPAGELSYILGNPPFIGSKLMTAEQREDLELVFDGMKKVGVLDYVSGWYIKATNYIKGTNVRVAFVSTNSITQGEQVGILWGELLKHGIIINFAHKTFKWSNEARGNAGVFCVIVGFSLVENTDKAVFEYETPIAQPHRLETKNINPYLVDAPNVVLTSHRKPICDVPEIGIGNKPIDGGNYLFTPEEKVLFLEKEPGAEKYFRRWLGAEEFINGIERWCLWLGDVPPEELRKLPEAMKRVDAVRQFRLASKSAPTRKLVETPTRFHVENMPESNYLLIPKVSSERRRYIPTGFIPPEVLSSDLVFIVPNASLYHFGVLTSEMHMAWVRHVCGRLESRYRYSKDIVYNNFPWPENPTEKQMKAVEEAAQGVLDARANHSGSTLADLYDPNAMPKDLRDAHTKLDRVVDACYGKRSFKSEMERLEMLFGMYQNLTEEHPPVAGNLDG